jgi:hypothetical protein
VQQRLVLVKVLENEPPSSTLGGIIPDNIMLTAADWKALAPSKADVGTKWTVPEAVARKFYALLSVCDT